MVVIDPDTIHHHATVMVILDHAGIALTTVVHPWQLEHLTALLAILKLSIVAHPPIYKLIGGKIIVENHIFKHVSCVWFVVFLLFYRLLLVFEFFLKSLESLIQVEFLHSTFNSARITKSNHHIHPE